MNYTFEISSIKFEVEQKATIKSVRLTVYPDGRVRIAAPLGTGAEFIRKFAASKIEWVEKHRQKFIKQAGFKPEAPGTLKNHSTVYVWGEALELEIIERRGNPKIVIDGGYMKYYTRQGSTRAKKLEYLDRWRRRILKEAAETLIKNWEGKIGVEVKKLYVRKMKSHWGSCNYERQTLRLNSELTKRKPECLEYVIVHEMVHIIERHHDKNFYRLLTQYIPAWKIIRKKMKTGE